MAIVRVLPGQPHWEAVSESEPEGQTSVAVPACYDCRTEFAEEYYGIPAEMLGERPKGKPERQCRLCQLPARDGELMALLRLWPDDGRYGTFAVDEPPEQTSYTIQICQSCRNEEEPNFLDRHGLKAIGRNLV